MKEDHNITIDFHMKNKALSTYKKRKLIEAFCDELTATQASHRLNLDRNTVNKYYKRIRECIAAYREHQKMRLLISAMSSPAQKPEVVSRQFPTGNTAQDKIPIRIMCLSGQLLTELDLETTAGVLPYKISVSDVMNSSGKMFEAEPGHFQGNGMLESLADEFHHFAAKRFRKYFGIKSDFAYFYMKEAEFVFNERDSFRRQHILNKMMDTIFSWK
jgi:transposase-like protein